MAGTGRTGLILASASPRRLMLLRQAGIEPDRVLAADIDETPHARELPRAYAMRMAAEKAEAALAALGGDARRHAVLAADTVVAAGRRILPKAADADGVRACLRLLSGRRHRVITAVMLAGPGEARRTRCVETIVTFARLTAQEIDAYAACGEGIGKAGGYAIQGRAEVFVRSLSGSWSNVVGLPLFQTVSLLRGMRS